jgi:hypothetical protein
MGSIISETYFLNWKTRQRIMSKKSIIVLIYHRHSILNFSALLIPAIRTSDLTNHSTKFHENPFCSWIVLCGRKYGQREAGRHGEANWHISWVYIVNEPYLQYIYKLIPIDNAKALCLHETKFQEDPPTWSETKYDIISCRSISCA